MGELTYQTLSISIKGYIDGLTVQGQVHEMSDRLMLMADKVEDRTFELIARFQPVATDLRTIKSYMKIGTTLHVMEGTPLTFRTLTTK
jgi:phosphate transport system protein